MDDELDSAGRDLVREREDAVSIARGVIIGIGVAVTVWVVVVAVTWQIANVVLSVLS